MHELHSNLKVLKACSAKSITADEAGDIIDRLGFRSLEFAAHIGVNANFDADNRIDMVIEHGDASDLSDAAKPAADDVIVMSGVTYSATTGIWATIDSTDEDDAIYKVGYKGLKRYVRITFDVTGTLTGGVPIGGAAVLGGAADLPIVQ